MFDDKLKFIGDGTTPVKTITDRNLLHDIKYLKEFGKTEYLITNPISETLPLL